MTDIKMSDVKLKSWVIDSHEMFYRDDILDNPNPLKDDMVAFYHCEKDMYQVKRNSVYGQILFKMINNGPAQINTHDTLTNQVADLNLELACVYKNLKSAYARAAISREKSIVQIDELRAALGEIKNITGKLSGQNPANFCEEVAMEHDAATFQIYEISNKALCKALKDGEL